MRNSILSVMVCLLLVSGFCGLACAGSIDSPIAHWTFDETSGTTAYDSAGSNNGTLVNGVSRTQGKIGGALDFDGINDYVNCGNSAVLGNFQQMTLSAWVYVHQFSTGTYQGRIISKRSWPDNSYDLVTGIQNGTSMAGAGFYGQNGIVGVKSTDYPFETNKWYHLAAANTGTVQKLYINGIEIAVTTVNTGPIVATDVPLWIGQFSNNYEDAAFNGLIDDVRIYDYALSGQEVALLVPEPATVVLMSLGGMALLRRKR